MYAVKIKFSYNILNSIIVKMLSIIIISMQSFWELNEIGVKQLIIIRISVFFQQNFFSTRNNFFFKLILKTMLVKISIKYITWLILVYNNK